jgi:predicted DNA-binding WGR domain protein
MKNYRWEKDYRYYEAHLEHDLYGWIIIRTWGRKQTRIGRGMKVRVDSYQEGLEKLEQLKKRRRSRGYELIGGAYHG